ncbi:MAG: hypothetical protein IJT32_08205 [Lachnospiraceae bacterium]|nr:hypothetical protein [Lachnospiraceae bacterium]
MIFAKSKAGHDKDEIYYVYAEDGADVILVNGDRRTMEYPKKKRKKHIQPINRISAEVQRILEEPDVLTDEAIRKALKKYQEERIVESRCH